MVPLLSAGVFFGLLAALLWGGGDFSGSIAVKRAGGNVRAALLVVLIGHVLSLTVVGSLAMFRGDAFPHGMPLAWGIGGGVIAGIALVGFYMALASGHMGPAAAVSGLLCAAVPALTSGLTEGFPGWNRIMGFLCAGVSIWMIASSGESGATTSRRAMWLSTLSGLGFGVYFVTLKLAGEAGVLWPMGTARIGSASTAAVLLIGMAALGKSDAGTPPAPSRPLPLAWIVAGATLDTGGNLSFLAATRAGRLDVAAVLASIYPATTILLAALVLKERTSARQRFGMLMALPAVVLITL